MFESAFLKRKSLIADGVAHFSKKFPIWSNQCGMYEVDLQPKIDCKREVCIERELFWFYDVFTFCVLSSVGPYFQRRCLTNAVNPMAVLKVSVE